MKQISGFNEKLHDINSRSCHSKEIRSERINKRVDEIGNEIKYLEQNTNESMTEDSPCGDWEPFKEEKCFKIFDKVNTQTYEDAEKTCQQQVNSSSLITIRFQEEQEFISNFLKTQKAANDIWIGVKYNNNKYKWTDDSHLIFTNWEQASPKNKSDRCVQMNSDETSFGKWSDVLCNKKESCCVPEDANMVTFSFAKLLLNTIKNPFPIGFIYVQLPNEKSPTEIWSWMIWKDVSSAYAGIFFRVTGGEAASFGQVQGDNSPKLIHVKRNDTSCTGDAKISANGYPSVPIDSGHGNGNDHCLEFTVCSGEVRPRNMAIRIWKEQDNLIIN